MAMHHSVARAEAFAAAHGFRLPVLMAPMAGACPPALAAAVTEAGGLGGCGAVLMQPDGIRDWARDLRRRSKGAFQINLWVPDPPPMRDAAREAAVRRLLAAWGPEVAAEAADGTPLDFDAQCQAMLEARPAIVSSIMGLYGPAFVAEL